MAPPTAGPKRMPKLARGGVEPDRARQIVAADDVVNHQDLGRRPEHSGDAVNDEQNAGVPDLNRIGQKQYRPHHRHAHVHDLRDLNQLAAVVAVGQAAEIDREQEKRRPMADDGEPGEHRRLKLLKQHPVADHMLDVVGHHRQHGGDKKPAVVFMLERGESDLRLRPIRSCRDTWVA